MRRLLAGLLVLSLLNPSAAVAAGVSVVVRAPGSALPVPTFTKATSLPGISGITGSHGFGRASSLAVFPQFPEFLAMPSSFGPAASAEVRIDFSAAQSEARGEIYAEFRSLESEFGTPVLGGDWVPVAPAPKAESAGTPASTPKKRSLRAIMGGAASYKLGMDAMAIAVPLALNSATMVAVAFAVWNAAQALSSSSSGGLFRRWAPQKVMSAALLVQAAAGAAMIGLMVAGAFVPAVVLPVYAVAGLAQGVVETARRVLPRSVLGPDTKAIEAFNSRTHIAYESAGVAGALATGVVIAVAGLPAALLANPIFYAVSAFVIRKVEPAFALEPEPPHLIRSGNPIADQVRGYKKTAGKLWNDPALRALSLALLLPQVVHRILEGFVFPQFAKQILHEPSRSGLMFGASNLGELLGALALLRLASGKAAAGRTWVRLTAAATLGLWMFVMPTPIALVLPLIAVQSMFWAGSDLKLSAELQSHPEVRPREIGFLFGCYLAVVTLVTLGLGLFFDAAGPGIGFIALNAGMTAVAAWMFFKNKLPTK